MRPRRGAVEIRREEVATMTRTLAKDTFATIFTALAVAVFLANHYDWNVYLVGSSNRWAIGAIGILSLAGCAMGSAIGAGKLDSMAIVLAIVGTATLVFLIVGLITGSQTMLALLTLGFVVLWAGSLLRHGVEGHVPTRFAHG
jgi:hypothetical protein